MKSAISAVLLASATSLPAFDNLDFEQIPVPTGTWTDEVPFWQHIGANSGGGAFWNVNLANLSGWAEASVVYLDDPEFPWTIWPSPPIEGQFSMAFSGSWPAGVTTADYFGPSYTNYGVNGDEDIGRAWIGQMGIIVADSTWLTLITDYTGPNYTYSWYSTNEIWEGYLTIYFEGTPVPFTLEDAGTGTVGQPLRQLWADLSPFGGQTGELRIGIEGPHTFVIDSIQLFPELVVLPGDINDDGMLNMNDFTSAMKIAVGQRGPTAAELAAGDINGNGILDKEDAHLILRMIKDLKRSP